MDRHFVYAIVLAIMLYAVAVQATPNLQVEIAETYKVVSPGSSVWFAVNLNSDLPPEPAMLSYEIRASDSTVITSKNESTSSDEIQKGIFGSIGLPNSSAEGPYALRVTYSSAAGEFEDEKPFFAINRMTEERTVMQRSLFDITVSVPEGYGVVKPGGEVLTIIKLTNIGSEGRIDVFLDYELEDFMGNGISRKRETVAIETQASFVRTFKIPDSALPGLYVIHTKLIYADGKEAGSTVSFEVGEPNVPANLKFDALCTTAIAAILISLGYFALRKSGGLLERTEIKWKVRTITRQKGLNKSAD